MLFVILFFVGHWYFSLFAQSFFHHRYAAHRAFTMSRFWEKFFYLFSYVMQGSSYMSPRAYGIMHRIHHAYTDTEHDPHSPSYDKNLLAMMRRTRLVYLDIFRHEEKYEPKFLKNLPDWRFVDRFGHNWYSRACWAAVYTLLYIYFAPSPWFYLLIPVHIVMGPLHGIIINWFAHKYGSTNFAVNNTSKNLFSVDLLMLGEAYHNNHHMHPHRSNFAAKRGEFDPVYPVILALHKMKVVRLNRRAVED